MEVVFSPNHGHAKMVILETKVVITAKSVEVKPATLMNAVSTLIIIARL